LEKEQKINRLLNSQPSGVVYLSSWLTENGLSIISYQLSMKKSSVRQHLVK
jgi:hypothetical protein